jgi:hypothetical protein
LNDYASNCQAASQANSWIKLPNENRNAKKEKDAYFGRIRFTTYPANSSLSTISSIDPISVNIEIESRKSMEIHSLALYLNNSENVKVMNADSLNTNTKLVLKPGLNGFDLMIDRLSLKPALYQIGLWLTSSKGEIVDHIENAASINIESRCIQMQRVNPRDDGIVDCHFSFTPSHHHHD